MIRPSRGLVFQESGPDLAAAVTVGRTSVGDTINHPDSSTELVGVLLVHSALDRRK